jgi:hypothetical protein
LADAPVPGVGKNKTKSNTTVWDENHARTAPRRVPSFDAQCRLRPPWRSCSVQAWVALGRLGVWAWCDACLQPRFRDCSEKCILALSSNGKILQVGYEFLKLEESNILLPLCLGNSRTAAPCSRIPRTQHTHTRTHTLSFSVPLLSAVSCWVHSLGKWRCVLWMANTPPQSTSWCGVLWQRGQSHRVCDGVMV